MMGNWIIIIAAEEKGTLGIARGRTEAGNLGSF